MTKNSNHPLTNISSTQIGLSGSDIARKIFEVQNPEEFVRTLPSQVIYFAVKELDISGAGELLEILTPKQYRLLLDFDLWSVDCFDEDSFWYWTNAIIDFDDLSQLKKFVQCVDPLLIALIITKHVLVISSEKQLDYPPQDGYYTPDRGYTWLKMNLKEEKKHYLLGKFLAVLFETNPNLFYQVLTSPYQTTSIELEEGAYRTRNNHLSMEGIPDFETSLRLNTGLKDSTAIKLLTESAVKSIEQDNNLRLIVPPLVSQGTTPILMETLCKELVLLKNDQLYFAEEQLQQFSKEQFEAELTLIANTAIIFYKVDFSDDQAISYLLSKVKGAINIGLEQARIIKPLPLSEIYAILGMQKLYQLGLEQLQQLRKLAEKILSFSPPDLGACDTGSILSPSLVERKLQAPEFTTVNEERSNVPFCRDRPKAGLCHRLLETDQVTSTIIEGANQLFPEKPRFLNIDGSFNQVKEGQLLSGFQPFISLQEVTSVKTALARFHSKLR